MKIISTSVLEEAVSKIQNFELTIKWRSQISKDFKQERV